jgi:disulfide bond formation protein DsbB
MMAIERHTSLIFLSFVIAVTAILTAWGFQLIGGYIPCKLCLEQRWGYYIALPLMAVALIVRVSIKVFFGFTLLAGVSLLWSAGLGAYQAGAEWGFWPGPSDCGGAGLGALGNQSLIDAMNNTRVVACDEASLRILGLSFAGWNVIAAGISGIVVLLAGFVASKAYGSSSTSQ